MRNPVFTFNFAVSQTRVLFAVLRVFPWPLSERSTGERRQTSAPEASGLLKDSVRPGRQALVSALFSGVVIQTGESRPIQGQFGF